MLGKVANLGGLFGNKSDHPLADPRELRRLIAEIPTDNAFKALDEVAGWLESLQQVTDFSPERLFEAVRQLDEAAQAHVRRLTRDYLHASRPSKSEEKRLWSIVHGFWSLVAGAYERCLSVAQGKEGGDKLKAVLPLLCCRLTGALGAMAKWDQFRYGPSDAKHWLRIGQAYLAAEAGGYAAKPLQLYPNQPGVTSVQQEYLKVLVCSASSMDSLLPFEIELAEHLVAHFLPGFLFSAEYRHDHVYWADPTQAHGPMRLARQPQAVSPKLRFFQPAAAFANLDALIHDVERGGEVPKDINLGGQYMAKTVLPVMRHLLLYWAPIPPQRRHDRHRVKHRMSVLNGLISAFVVYSEEFGGKPVGLQVESWVVDNVSRGGFGAAVGAVAGEWIKVGALVILQPEGGDNWILGVVRRYTRENDNEAHVGIETLARQVRSVELRPRTASTYAAAGGVPALLLQDGNEPGEVRLVLPFASFDLREAMEFDHEGRRILLNPVAQVDQTPDYEVARYRPTAL